MKYSISSKRHGKSLTRQSGLALRNLGVTGHCKPAFRGFISTHFLLLVFELNHRISSVVILASILAVAACQTIGGTVDLVHKTGSTFEQRRSVIDSCQVAALQQVPPSYRTRTVGGYRSFGPRYCVGFSCYGYRGYGYAPMIVSTDPNEALRARRFQRCLGQKGYSVISRPTCNSEGEALAYKSRSRQASAASIACVAGEPRLESRWMRTR